MRRHIGKKRGFSMLELMVVLGTIGILSAIAIPQFTYSVYAAKDMEAIETVAGVQRLLVDYYNSNGQYPPMVGDWNPSDALGGGTKRVPWTDGLPGWKELGFKADGQAYTFQYRFTPTLDPATGKYTTVTLEAQSDLDGDGSKLTKHLIILHDGAVQQFDNAILE